jgi:hypothetical protein
MKQHLKQTIAVLARTPSGLNELLTDLPEAWTHSNEGGDTWSVYEVIGHLIYADRVDWLPRAKRILQFGESQPFDPFDRSGHVEEIRGTSLQELLDEFERVRSANLDDLRALNLRDEQLDLRGRHPALGAVTLSELLATWAVHDLTHLHQIARVMAYQYREAVGPWGAYLGVLHCSGHSPP